MADSDASRSRLNLEKPRHDQSTYTGRVQHFLITTNPMNITLMKARLFFARDVVEAYKRGEKLPYTDDQIWNYKHQVDSAFHPDTGELMFVLGRMSAQVPMNMLITGFMMHFRSNFMHVIFWQWINQTFNAVVNYTNSNMQGKVSEEESSEQKRLMTSYLCATGGAVGTALSLNAIKPKFPPIFGRFVPFAAVAAANCINIPIMRNREITNGIPVFTDNNEYIGDSKVAAKTGIFQVILSRIAMASPGMVVPSLIMHRLERTRTFKSYPVLAAPTTVLLVGLMLTFSTPLCCAMFPQQSSISRSRLEPELQDKLAATGSNTQRVYFNKGL